MNHCDHPNCDDWSDPINTIDAGEELTCDYSKFYINTDGSPWHGFE